MDMSDEGCHLRSMAVPTFRTGKGSELVGREILSPFGSSLTHLDSASHSRPVIEGVGSSRKSGTKVAS